MKNIAKIISAVLLSIVLIGISLYCFAEEGTKDATELIKEAKIYIQQGDKEKAILTLDAVFELANTAGDYNLLMEIGDLYVGIDSSLKEKAMEAWIAAGRWKCR